MNRSVRIGDFKVSDEEKKIVMDILSSERITEGIKTREFERKWAKKIGTNYSVAVNSGTSALIAGLFALKYLAEDEKRKKVITTPTTYIADSNAIKIAGLEPVFGDIDKTRFSLVPSEIEKILNENDPTEFLAILPVHLMGYPCDMDKINEIAKRNNLYVLEDSAQAHGSRYNGTTVGSFGDLSIFSFYVAHNIQVGELGAVNTSNLKIKNLVKRIKANGRLCFCDVCTRLEGKCPLANKQEEDIDPRFTHDIIGFNFKTFDLITGLASHKMDEMESIAEERRKNVAYLNEGLKEHSKILQLPLYSEEVSYLGYPLILKEGKRKIIRAELEKRGIETRAFFGCIPLQQPSFSYLKEEYQGKLPNAEHIGKNGFYIGCHQYLEEKDLDYIVDSFSEMFNK
jgi:CDP-6-deoxy-D-xylo-4-hexulose-3-dehydrase